MASVPLFALFGKLSSKRLSNFFLLHKITLLITFFMASMKIFINLKAQNQSILSKKPF